jgi:phosphoglycerate dehydrogenase-like enzyme
MMFILMLTRRYPVALKNLQDGILYQPMGMELDGLRLGIVGFGASGKEYDGPRISDHAIG